MLLRQVDLFYSENGLSSSRRAHFASLVRLIVLSRRLYFFILFFFIIIIFVQFVMQHCFWFCSLSN